MSAARVLPHRGRRQLRRLGLLIPSPPAPRLPGLRRCRSWTGAGRRDKTARVRSPNSRHSRCWRREASCREGDADDPAIRAESRGQCHPSPDMGALGHGRVGVEHNIGYANRGSLSASESSTLSRSASRPFSRMSAAVVSMQTVLPIHPDEYRVGWKKRYHHEQGDGPHHRPGRAPRRSP